MGLQVRVLALGTCQAEAAAVEPPGLTNSHQAPQAAGNSRDLVCRPDQDTLRLAAVHTVLLQLLITASVVSQRLLCLNSSSCIVIIISSSSSGRATQCSRLHCHLLE
jgi:hypothetical protein